MLASRTYRRQSIKLYELLWEIPCVMHWVWCVRLDVCNLTRSPQLCESGMSYGMSESGKLYGVFIRLWCLWGVVGLMTLVFWCHACSFSFRCHTSDKDMTAANTAVCIYTTPGALRASGVVYIESVVFYSCLHIHHQIADTSHFPIVSRPKPDGRVYLRCPKYIYIYIYIYAYGYKGIDRC